MSVTNGPVRFLLVSDTATEIPVMVVSCLDVVPGSTAAVVLRRAGYSPTKMFIVTDLLSSKTTDRPHEWRGNNTLKAFHMALEEGTDVCGAIARGDETIDVRVWREHYGKNGRLA